MGYLETARRFVATTEGGGAPEPAARARRNERDEQDEEGPAASGVSSSASCVSLPTDNRPSVADGEGPDPTKDAQIAATVANVSALSPEERRGWHREVVAALRWRESGHEPDATLGHDVAALRRLVPPGECFDCGGPCPRDGRHWCHACEHQPVMDAS